MEPLLAALAVILIIVLAIAYAIAGLVWLTRMIKKASDNLSHDVLDLDYTYDD